MSLEAAVLDHLNTSKLRLFLFHTFYEHTEGPESQCRHWKILWKVIIYSSSFFLSPYSSLFYHCRPISSGDFCQGAKAEMKLFFFSQLECILTCWTFFFHWQAKKIFAKVKCLWKFKTGMAFLYLPSILVTSVRLQKWDLNRDLPNI